MGPFRQQLIHIVACLVAIDVAAGVVAIDARSNKHPAVTTGGRIEHAAPPAAGASDGGGAGARSGGVLAGGSFSKRRRSIGQPTSGGSTEAAAATTGATAPAVAPPSGAMPSSTRPPAVSTGGSSQSGTRRPTAPAAGQPATTPASGPAARSTAPAGTQSPGQAGPVEEGNPPTGAAPAGTSTTPSSGPPKVSTPSTTSGVWTVIDDPTGDTFVDATRTPQANARADIVQSRGANTTKGIGLAVKVAQPADPTKDPTWASDATFVLWEVDTSGDGKPDFEIEYFVDGGKLIAGVNRVTSSGNQAACEAEAGYMSDNYMVGIDPGCLGTPASLSFRATVYYATDPGNQNADSITDVSPDGGMSPPVRRTSA